MAAESAWCWPWLGSGAACFLFFNVVVGAVAVLSWAQGGDEQVARRRRLTRSASSMVMERLRSMSVFAAFHSVPEHDYDSGLTPPASPSQLHHVQEYYTSSQEEGGEEIRHAVRPEPTLPAGESMTATVAPSTQSAPGAAAEAGLRSAASMSGSDKAGAETRTETSRCLGDACTAVALAFRQRDAPAPEPTPATAAAKGATTEKLRKREPAKVAEIVERRAYAEVEEKAEVNARAERFIRQFREELKLERIKSMLNQSAAAAASAR
ncbi:hypothetical protein CFC21_096328 [Triticum aestivum]|uniref:DUF4408 domain-containing protein n=2 Tax=Triticum aestivum TaxID=4565 RepID=A0A3B6RE47_WHEAT|nr:uncharacterized protein LOC123148188 [Triticum aestivum]KAF7093962.1 hypothetical protein CFC21_096328 [Triticum aestivum]